MAGPKTVEYYSPTTFSNYFYNIDPKRMDDFKQAVRECDNIVKGDLGIESKGVNLYVSFTHKCYMGLHRFDVKPPKVK